MPRMCILLPDGSLIGGMIWPTDVAMPDVGDLESSVGC